MFYIIFKILMVTWYAYDVGLCGVFDYDRDNELTTSNGTLSKETGKRPNKFSDSWRYLIFLNYI